MNKCAQYPAQGEGEISHYPMHILRVVGVGIDFSASLCADVWKNLSLVHTRPVVTPVKRKKMCGKDLEI